jgi:hypothetical protein
MRAGSHSAHRLINHHLATWVKCVWWYSLPGIDFARRSHRCFLLNCIGRSCSRVMPVKKCACHGCCPRPSRRCPQSQLPTHSLVCRLRLFPRWASPTSIGPWCMDWWRDRRQNLFDSNLRASYWAGSFSRCGTFPQQLSHPEDPLPLRASDELASWLQISRSHCWRLSNACTLGWTHFMSLPP